MIPSRSSRQDCISSPPLPTQNIKPGRRRRLWRWRPKSLTLIQALPFAFALLVMSVSTVAAVPSDETERLTARAPAADADASSWQGGILVDPRADARVWDWHADPRSDDPYSVHIRPRDDDQQSTTPSVTSRFASASVTATPSAAVTSVLVASDPAVATELPSPFDTNLGNNFTSSSCPQFFKTFLNDAAFKGCLPLSLLLLVRSLLCSRLQYPSSPFPHLTPSQEIVQLTKPYRTPNPSSPCKRTPSPCLASYPPLATSSRPTAKT